MPSVITAPPSNAQAPVVNPGAPAEHQTIGPPPQTWGARPIPYAEDLKEGTIGVAYSETISVSGGHAPFLFALTGTLPTGCALNTATGVISGIPTAAGSFTFTIGVTDADGLTGSQTFTIAISAATSGGGNYGWVA